MTFEEFFDKQIRQNNYGGELETVVRDIVKDAIKTAKDICRDTWKVAQKEIESDSTQQLKDEIARWVATYPEDLSKCDPDDGGYESHYKDLLFDIRRAISAKP